MKLAILGTGMIVKDLLPVLQEIKGIDLNAIVSTPRSVDVARELAKALLFQQLQVILTVFLPQKMWIPFISQPLIICIMRGRKRLF